MVLRKLFIIILCVLILSVIFFLLLRKDGEYKFVFPKYSKTSEPIVCITLDGYDKNQGGIIYELKPLKEIKFSAHKDNLISSLPFGLVFNNRNIEVELFNKGEKDDFQDLEWHICIDGEKHYVEHWKYKGEKSQLVCRGPNWNVRVLNYKPDVRIAE